MKILDKPITIDNLRDVATETFGDLVKAVVDVGRRVVAIDAELHADLEAFLLEDGSRQQDLWGINFYPGLKGEDFIEFDSMINMRPSQGNMSRGIDDESIRRDVVAVVDQWVVR